MKELSCHRSTLLDFSQSSGVLVVSIKSKSLAENGIEHFEIQCYEGQNRVFYSILKNCIKEVNFGCQEQVGEQVSSTSMHILPRYRSKFPLPIVSCSNLKIQENKKFDHISDRPTDPYFAIKMTLTKHF